MTFEDIALWTTLGGIAGLYLLEKLVPGRQLPHVKLRTHLTIPS